MGAFQGLNVFFSDKLINIAVEMNYDLDNIAVLEGDIEALKRHYPETYSNLLSCNHHRDRRLPIDYAKDLVASWIFEDYLIDQFRSVGFDLTLSGADKTRKVLASQHVRSDSDYLLNYDGKLIPIEIMSDYSGWWSRYHKIDLRDSKFKKLCTSESLFLGICVLSHEYLILSFKDGLVAAKYIPSHYPYGGKPAYEISIDETALQTFSISSIIADLEYLI